MRVVTGAAAAMSVALAGVTPAASATPVAGEAITSENVEAIILKGLESYLRDPSSAVLKITRGPIRGTAKSPRLSRTGYFVCGELNAKNGYGGYVGSKPYLFVITADTLKVEPLERLGNYPENVDLWREVCLLDPPNVKPAS